MNWKPCGQAVTNVIWGKVQLKGHPKNDTGGSFELSGPVSISAMKDVMYDEKNRSVLLKNRRILLNWAWW